MSDSSNFLDGFLDGFAPGGFLRRSRPAVEISNLFAAEPERRSALWDAVTFEPASARSGEVAVAGNLHSIPESALRGMIDLLKREDESRNKTPQQELRAGYGARQ